jgi:hypothetical protein
MGVWLLKSFMHQDVRRASSLYLPSSVIAFELQLWVWTQ